MNNICFYILCDSPEKYQISFQDGASNNSQELILFHDYVMIIIVTILGIVGWLLFKAIINKKYNKYLIENTNIEFIWTCIPAFILITIAIPSLKLLYTMDELISTPLTIKVTGHQWYWSYEYPESLGGNEYDSYMVPSSDLSTGQHRLLEVDNPLYVPNKIGVRVIVTGADVIHSFAVPSLGVKADAIPGKLNQAYFFANRIGTFYGQCSEICGSDHSFMPICVKTLPLKEFIKLV